MSEIDVGVRAQNIDIGEEGLNITRVNLVVDSDHMYTAGNDTGRTMEVECPWGTQAMADRILAAMSNVQYRPYTAERALVDPAFELGDVVIVGDIYSQIISADFTYNGAGLATIGAPDLDEIDDEYPAGQNQNSSFKRQLAYTRSLISKTNKEIELAIYGENSKGGLNGRMNTFTMGLSGISGQIKGYQETLDGYKKQLADYQLDLDGFNADLKTYSEDVNGYKEQVGDYTLAVNRFDLRVEEYGRQAEAYTKEYTSISGKIGSLSLEVTNGDATASIQLKADGQAVGAPATIDISGMVTFTDLKTSGKTVIHGGNITTGKIAAERLSLTGAITWNDLSVGCKEKIGDGLTEDDVTTYIDSSLVSSPTIKGGKFRDLNDVAQLRLTYDDDSEIPTLVYSELGLGGRRNMFAIAPFQANSEWIGLVLGGQAIMIGYNGKVQVYGDWDFSGADVTFDPDKVSGL